MSFRIECKNEFGILISMQQLANIDNFSKLYYEDENLTKEEIFEDKILSEGIYYLLPGQNYTDVLNQIDISVLWDFKSDREIINTFEVWESRIYKSGELSSNYSREVYFNGKNIAGQSYTSSSEPIGGIYKILDLSNVILNNNGYIIKFPNGSSYNFYFNSKGVLYRIFPDTGGWDRPYDRLSKFLEDDPIVSHLSSEQLNYFTIAEPLIPESAVILL
ncbi:hypothetical protein [Flavobacterium rivuli]|nr:hypothetical protein [Flavobacterium rivuli]